MLTKLRVGVMAIMFMCKHCNSLKPANIRLKGTQRYCSQRDCQRARKAAWQKDKMAHDPRYRAQQHSCIRAWRKKRPLDQYQKHYRLEHPEYVKRNRQLQKIRNEKRSKQLTVQKIVKMDALKKPGEKSKAYLMSPYKMDDSGKIVKMDPLIVQLSHLQTDLRPFLSVSPGL